MAGKNLKKKNKRRKNKVFAIPKNKRCICGKKITHHHFLCNDCWRLNEETKRLKRKAMQKIRGSNIFK